MCIIMNYSHMRHYLFCASHDCERLYMLLFLFDFQLDGNVICSILVNEELKKLCYVICSWGYFGKSKHFVVEHQNITWNKPGIFLCSKGKMQNLRRFLNVHKTTNGQVLLLNYNQITYHVPKISQIQLFVVQFFFLLRVFLI